MSDASPEERMHAMLRELELRLEQARGHEQRMRDGVAEAVTWGESVDRQWITRAASEAIADRERAEQTLAARAAVRKTVAGSPVAHALELEAACSAIARCRCGARWVVPVCAVRRMLPGIYAHTPGALICGVCGNPASLDAALAPAQSTDPQEYMP